MRLIIALLLFSVIVRGSVNYDNPDDQFLIDNKISDHDTHLRIDSEDEDDGPQLCASFPYPVFVSDVFIKPGQRVNRSIEAVKGIRFSLDPDLCTSIVAKIYGAAQVVSVNVQVGKFYLSGHPLFDYVDKRGPSGLPEVDPLHWTKND